MYQWIGKYEDYDTGKEFTHIFDDSNIFFDCVCESYREKIDAMVGKCYQYAINADLHFIGFEIIAE